MADIRIKFPSPCGENWNAMSPQGCNRHCAVCDQTIFDLSKLNIESAEALIRSADQLCVRAELDTNGAVKLKQDGQASARRMVAILGAAIGLVATPTVAFAEQEQPSEISAKVRPAKKLEFHGMITGKMRSYETKVIAYGNGKKYRGKVNKKDMTFSISNLPDGTYSVWFENKFWPRCTEERIIESVIVDGAKPAIANEKDAKLPENEEGCPIVVGLVTIETAIG